MLTFIFYTLEGYTEGPDGESAENCQLLGEARGETVNDAFSNLLNENPWIEAYGFKVGAGKVVARELVDAKRYLL